MFRKDVRIGLAIGGGLLAVLVVYLLITSGPPRNAEVTLAPDSTAAQPEPAGGVSNFDTVASDPVKSPPQASGPTTAPQEGRWERALTTGKVESETPPLLLTETPTPAPQTPQNDVRRTSPSTSPAAIAPSQEPSTASNPSGQRTHVVQNGETFSTIALVAYGNSSYYPHLIRANPSIDPKKLRPGMTIVIPEASQVVAKAAAEPGAASDSSHAAIDPSREYRVRPSDSLYKIALKLYGKADRADAIYELNKDAIGPNRSYLKVGMTLKLPEPPTQTTAGR